MTPKSTLSRRNLLTHVLTGFLGTSMLSRPADVLAKEQTPNLRDGFSIDNHRLKLFSRAIKQPIKLFYISDTHLSREDDRDIGYQDYSSRMAKAYRETQHFIHRGKTNPESAFVETLEEARKQRADLVILGGDLMSFPSLAATEWLLEQLKKAELPWVYTAGNHDWHYEGMAGSSIELRDTWIKKRLQELYQGANPLAHHQTLKGLEILIVDNSVYEILPEQLELTLQVIQSGKPFLLAMHIPLYAPGRPVGFGCGHPQWGASTDRHFEIERRLRWKERHSDVTMTFHQAVWNAPNLLGILAGHIHQQSIDVLHGIPQIVSGANATGAHLQIDLLPHEIL